MYRRSLRLSPAAHCISLIFRSGIDKLDAHAGTLRLAIPFASQSCTKPPQWLWSIILICRSSPSRSSSDRRLGIVGGKRIRARGYARHRHACDMQERGTCTRTYANITTYTVNRFPLHIALCSKHTIIIAHALVRRYCPFGACTIPSIPPPHPPAFS